MTGNRFVPLSRPPIRHAGPVWAWLVLGAMLLAGSAQAASFRARLEPTTIRMGESATLELIFEDLQPDGVPTLPDVPKLSFAAVGRETRLNFVNGRQSSTLLFRYLVMASEPGNYTLPAISVTAGGRRHESLPLRLTVLAAGAPGRGGRDEGGGTPARAFLEIAVPRTNVFLGEVLPVELQVFAINPRQFELGPLPAEGFTLGKEARIEPERVPVNGVFYTRMGKRTSVVPTRPGALQLGPASGRVEVLVPLARRRGDLFDEFFNDPFFNRAAEPVVLPLSAPAVAIQVLPLPATNVPPSFTGAVGEYKLEATAAPTNVAVGEPIRLRVQIQGRGALAGLTLPPLDGWTDFRVYPAQTRVDYTDALGLEGAKIIEYDLIPQNAEVKAVPALDFAFFDPVNQTYVTREHPPIPLLVRPVGSRAPALAASEAAPPARDIVHLKARLEPLLAVGPSWTSRPAYLFTLLLPVVLWLAALTWRKRAEHLAANPRQLRRRTVTRRVRTGLQELERLADSRDTAPFFALACDLLQEQLGERLDLPAAAITEAVLEEHLRPRGAAEPLLAELHALFQACNQARYAPAGSAQDRRDFTARLRRALDALRRLELA